MALSVFFQSERLNVPLVSFVPVSRQIVNKYLPTKVNKNERADINMYLLPYAYITQLISSVILVSRL